MNAIGMTVMVAVMLPWTGALAATFTTLHSFSNDTDGAYSVVGLVQATNGTFYGTTYLGGTNNQGTVFESTATGAVTPLYQFGGGTDGVHPAAALVLGSDGYFYGTAFDGGTSDSGTVFKITSAGTLTPLYQFSGGTNGAGPNGLIQATDGNFYGTTSSGGSSDNGTVFKITSAGTFTPLHVFTGGSDGGNPFAGLVQGRDGNFYGTAYLGGTTGNGTVFKITSAGTLTPLHQFTDTDGDGSGPFAALVQGNDGSFYGTTEFGGTNENGTVFKITSTGALTNLYQLMGGDDGYFPVAGLVQGSDGDFYGTTLSGGTSDTGTVFRVSPAGAWSMLHSFSGTDGAAPQGALVQGVDGDFYGTTSIGADGWGTIFKVFAAFGSPANQISAIQLAGTNVLVTVPSVAPEIYQLQYRTSLTVGTWADVAGASATSIGGILTLTNFAGANQPQGFYRFAITP